MSIDLTFLRQLIFHIIHAWFVKLRGSCYRKLYYNSIRDYCLNYSRWVPPCYIAQCRRKVQNSEGGTKIYKYSKASRYTALSCTDLPGARFWIGSKKIEMNEFMQWKPWAAQFSDHLAFILLSKKCCTSFFFPQKTLL